jgi:K+-sensing histidine kinase KdpD
MKKARLPELKAEEHEQDIVMVCVTRQRTCARLIERGEAIAAERGLPLHVVHAVKTGQNFLGNAYEGEALEYLFTAAQLSGAEMTMLRTDDVEESLAEYARAHEAQVMVLGESPQTGDESFVGRMQKKLPKLTIITA